MGTKIYKLLCPDTGKVRYIGMTTTSLHKRLVGHISGALLRRKKKTTKNVWIRNLILKGKVPLIRLVKEIPNSQWQKWERFYIKQFKDEGCELTNMTEGGLGVKRYTHTSKTKRKMRLRKLGKTGLACPNSKGCVGYNDNEKLIFSCTREAEDYLKKQGYKGSRKNISQCINGYSLIRGKHKRKSVAGFKWRRATKNEMSNLNIGRK